MAGIGLAEAPTPPPMYQVGERISLTDIDFSSAGQTLLLVVRKGCRFCEESMPFYRRLGDDLTLGRRARIVVVAPDDEAVSRAELQRYEVRADQVVRIGLDQLKVRGTPTAIVVDRASVIRQVLTGRLEETQQRELINLLRGVPRP
jgi:hypothetical protein